MLKYGKTSTKESMRLENEYGAHNYHPLPIVIAKGEGVNVWDPEGKKYMDFLSAYSAVNQGHCHPHIIKALNEQAETLTLTSRAFYNNRLGEFEKFTTEFFGYEMMLPMNTGAEGVETAMKIARRWGHDTKGIPENEGIIVTAEGNFHGRTITIISFSTDPTCRRAFGPYTPGFEHVPYNDIPALEKLFEEKGEKIAAFLIEPIQGEAGVNVPDDGYLKKAYDLCKKHNILMIADEIQTGIARTGKLLCQEHDGVKADMVILGKALSGGVFPISAVLTSKDIMMLIKPGEHGSTYGGNPLACAVGKAALEVIRDENMTERAVTLGKRFRDGLKKIKSPFIKLIRGKGLLNAVIIKPQNDVEAWDVCVKMKENGLLAKPTHEHIIRFAPPLVITEEQIDEALEIIEKTLKQMEK
ncbi:MAG: ornithine--oxo-acid transaminase [Candidatus Zixiibacteriota bacterium]